MPKEKESKCNCVTEANEVLMKTRGYGMDLAYSLSRGGGTFPQIKLDTKRRGQVLLPTFCPFCGKKYPR